MILETPASGSGHGRCQLVALRFFAGTLLMLGSGAVLAQPLTFANLYTDLEASGDDKIAADIDLDGDDDGVLGGRPITPGNSVNELVWYRSSGAGRSFTMFALLTAGVEFTTDISVGDIDSDGDIDLIYADGPGSDNVAWLENPVIDPPVAGSDPTVAGNWLEHTIGTHGNWAHDFEVGYLDAGAALDVVTMGNGFFKIHFQNSPTDWSTVSFAQFADDGSPAIADIDGDGDRDIFVPGGWIESPPADRRVPNNWTFHAITNSNPGDGPAALALDVDRDGRIDLVTCPQHGNSGPLAWFKNPANPETPNWTRREISPSAGSHHLRAADFDGDGRLDLLTGLELGAITVRRITGAPGAVPTFTPYPVAASGGHNAAVGDFDGNGLPDIWASDYIQEEPLRAYFNGPNVIFRDGFETGNTSKWSLGS